MIRWISNAIGIAAFSDVDIALDAYIVDVRDLVDKPGNTASAIRAKLDEALDARKAGRQVIVCCDFGISRSSAIAAGVIAMEAQISYDDAVRQVVDATGETAMRIEVLADVRSVFEGTAPSGTPREGRSLLVTGGSGFLGQKLTKKLGATCRVATPSRDEIDLARDAIALDVLVRRQQVDTVVHLANPRITTTNHGLGEMLLSLKNVLDVCVQQDVHFVFPSTWEVFSGYRTGYLLADESVSPLPSSTYGHAKLLCERLIEQVHAQKGLRHTVIRIGPVYGPEGARPKFIWNFIDKALRNENIVVHCYRNGEPALDLTYVDDVVEALGAVVERRPKGLLHLGSAVTTTTEQIAEMIVSLTGAVSTIEQRDVDGYTANIAMDNGRARDQLGWIPTKPLEYGLRELIAEARAGKR